MIPCSTVCSQDNIRYHVLTTKNTKPPLGIVVHPQPKSSAWLMIIFSKFTGCSSQSRAQHQSSILWPFPYTRTRLPRIIISSLAGMRWGVVSKSDHINCQLTFPFLYAIEPSAGVICSTTMALSSILALAILFQNLHPILQSGMFCCFCFSLSTSFSC